MIQAAAPPPWPEAVVPTSEEAEAFLAKLRPGIPETASKHQSSGIKLPAAAMHKSPSIPTLQNTPVSPTDSTSMSPISAPCFPSRGSTPPGSNGAEGNENASSSPVPYTSHMGLLSREEHDEDELDVSAKNTKLESALAGSPGARVDTNWWNCVFCSSAGHCGR